MKTHEKLAVYAKKLHQKASEDEEDQDDTPDIPVSPQAKEAQKKRIKRRQHEEAAKKKARDEANNIGDIRRRFVDKAQDLTGALAENVKEAVEEHPLFVVGAAGLFLLIALLAGSLTSCTTAMTQIVTTSVYTSFTADNEDILEVEAAYKAKESALQQTIKNMPKDHPGYNQYNYSLAEISHNPYQLAALLTVLYEDYDLDRVEDMLQVIFGKQYTLTLTEKVEVRYRTETRTGRRWVDGGKDENGNATGYWESYSYNVQVPYNFYILNTSLKNNGIEAAVSSLNLTTEQLERYQILLQTYGNKQGIFGDSVFSTPQVSEKYQNYEVPSEYLTDQRFANIINEAKKYLGYPYVWGGASPSTSFDCSGFVSYVINHCGNGWNYGRLTANGWKNVTSRLSESEVKAGDLIFFQGTYDTSGASHVGIVVDPVNKIMIHCGNPIQYASYDTNYWRAHFYCYGRIQ